ncbi:MAG TPA: hypothetical protein VGK58_05320 [Lacipirellulaceae bacterium]
MRELLIRYLLGELDAAQQRRLEDELRNSPELRRELVHLQSCFSAAQVADHASGEPPCGLARRVTDSVCGDSGFTRSAAQAEPPAGVLGWSLADLTVAGGVFLAVSMLLFPALRDSRDATRRNVCANNLQNMHLVLARYAENHGNYFPGIHPQDYAGMFVVRLMHEDYVRPDDVAQLLVCPSSRLADERREEPVGLHLARFDNMHSVVGPQLARLCREAVGSYAVRIGYVDRDQYFWIRDDRSDRTPLMADEPDFQVAGVGSANHDGYGQNVLYSSGRVVFLTSVTLPGKDHAFLNANGLPAAGLGPNDVVLVSGDRTP